MTKRVVKKINFMKNILLRRETDDTETVSVKEIVAYAKQQPEYKQACPYIALLLRENYREAADEITAYFKQSIFYHVNNYGTFVAQMEGEQRFYAYPKEMEE